MWQWSIFNSRFLVFRRLLRKNCKILSYVEFNEQQFLFEEFPFCIDISRDFWRRSAGWWAKLLRVLRWFLVPLLFKRHQSQLVCGEKYVVADFSSFISISIVLSHHVFNFHCFIFPSNFALIRTTLLKRAKYILTFLFFVPIFLHIHRQRNIEFFINQHSASHSEKEFTTALSYVISFVFSLIFISYNLVNYDYQYLVQQGRGAVIPLSVWWVLPIFNQIPPPN